MKTISLTQGKVTLVDDADFEWLNQWKWHAQWDRRAKKFYARRCEWKDGKIWKRIVMHRVIAAATGLAQVDHKDNDGLNNQRENLRPCTAQQNCANRKKRPGLTSRFKGVRKFRSGPNPWMAQIKINSRAVHLGCFPTEELAAEAYDRAAVRAHGEFARTNLP